MKKQKYRLSKISFIALEGKKHLNVKQPIKSRKINKRKLDIPYYLEIPN